MYFFPICEYKYNTLHATNYTDEWTQLREQLLNINDNQQSLFDASLWSQLKGSTKMYWVWSESNWFWQNI